MKPWYRAFYRAIWGMYFDRISVLCRERLPGGGPVIYVAMHRNGAVDGFVYGTLLPRAEFMLSGQLTGNWFSRLFFDGFTVLREKDEPDAATRKTYNLRTLTRCADHVLQGGELVVFPEGTSSLGPRHLPIKSGAAHLVAQCMDEGVVPAVVPLGIHYERAWAFRSRVEVVVGEAIDIRLPDDMPPRRRTVELKRQMTRALESVSANFDSGKAQRQAEQLACIATLGTDAAYFDSLKRMEGGLPICDGWEAIERELEGSGAFRYQDVPLFPTESTWLYALYGLILIPIVATAAVANCVPLLGAWLAGKTLADDNNVISLWRILVGTPLLAIWGIGWLSVSLALGQALLFPAYLLVSWLGGKTWYRLKKLGCAVGNALFHRRFRDQALEQYSFLLNQLTGKK